MPLSRHRSRGITLTEVTVIIVYLFVLGAVLLPVFMQQPRRRHHISGDSNQKQIALGFLQYIQDYDERSPPGIGYALLPPPGYVSSPGTAAPTVAARRGPDRRLPDGRIVPGLLSPYIKSNQLFVDPQALPHRPGEFALDYLYNDLLVGVKQEQITVVSATILTTDSENRFANVGHALALDAPPVDARFNARGGCDAGEGATVGRTARFRHSAGANFAYTDGHVKWAPGGMSDPIFFPPRTSASISAIDPKTKQQTGPVPGDKMTFGGRVYIGTFHVR